jgi:hypothetical protein
LTGFDLLNDADAVEYLTRTPQIPYNPKIKKKKEKKLS